MSESDINTVINKLIRKLFWFLIVPILVILISAKVIDIWGQNKRAEGYYIELFRLTAELSTTQAMYMKANDEDKVELGKRIDYLIERMDKFADHDMKRGETKIETDSNKRKYGLEFSSLI